MELTDFAVGPEGVPPCLLSHTDSEQMCELVRVISVLSYLESRVRSLCINSRAVVKNGLSPWPAFLDPS